MTGKSYNLPGSKIGNVASESVFDTEAVQNVVERLLKVTAKFRIRQVDMHRKLENCQSKIREYQH